MSKCISRHGEYSEHQFPESPSSTNQFVCELCWTFDEEAAQGALDAANQEADRLRSALRDVYACLEKPAVIIGAASMPIRYENARKAALRALSA